MQEPPRRVNIKVPYTQINVSDFLFTEETQEESVKAVADMLGFTPNFEHLHVGAGNEMVARPQLIWVSFFNLMSMINSQLHKCHFFLLHYFPFEYFVLCWTLT